MSLQIVKHREQVNSKAYEHYLHSCPCDGCGSWIGVQISHMASKKWAEGSILKALPACQQCHPQSTRSARILLERKGVKIEERQRFHQERFRRMQKLPDGDFEAVMLESGLAYRGDGSKRKNRKEFTKKFTNPFV